MTPTNLQEGDLEKAEEWVKWHENYAEGYTPGEQPDQMIIDKHIGCAALIRRLIAEIKRKEVGEPEVLAGCLGVLIKYPRVIKSAGDDWRPYYVEYTKEQFTELLAALPQDNPKET